MSQQINLLNPQLIRPRDWLSLRNLALIYLVALAGMVMLYQQQKTQADALQAQRNQAVASFEAAKKQLEQVSAAMHAPTDSAAQERERDNLQKKYEGQQRILAAFRQIQTDTGHHVLDVMRGFAEIRQPEVWLTGFKLNAFDRSVALTGRAMQADQVPAYLEKLGKVSVFQGQLFSGVTLKSSQAPITSTAKTEVPSSPQTNATVAAASKEVQPTPLSKPLTWIDFEVKGYAQAALTEIELPAAPSTTSAPSTASTTAPASANTPANPSSSTDRAGAKP